MGLSRKESFRTLITREYHKRKEENPSYAWKHFSEYLDFDEVKLKGILSGQQALNRSKIPGIISALKFNENESKVFFDTAICSDGSSCDKVKPKTRKYFKINDEQRYYEIVSEWEHFAVLNMTETERFKPKIEYICDQLDITPTRARKVVKNLLNAGFMKINEKTGDWERTFQNSKVGNGAKSMAMRAANRNIIDLAREKVEWVPLEDRSFTRMTFDMDVDKIPLAKVLIEDFKKNFYNLVCSKKTSDVFQMNIQFFPLTKLEKWENENNENQPINI